jgi:hypothetical protein
VRYWTHRNIKATRKTHTCEGCGKKIPAGSSAYYWAGDCDGDFYSCYYHDDCRAAEVSWNEAREAWGDEYDSLCAVRDEPEDVAWLVENHPEVAARMGLIIKSTATQSGATP